MLILATLACSLPGGGKATPVQQEATAIPTESSGEAPAPEVAPDALAGLDSYRARITSQWTPTGGTPQGMTLVEEYTCTSPPPTSRTK
jgi:hypothetical protein